MNEKIINEAKKRHNNRAMLLLFSLLKLHLCVCSPFMYTHVTSECVINVYLLSSHTHNSPRYIFASTQCVAYTLNAATIFHSQKLHMQILSKLMGT